MKKPKEDARSRKRAERLQREANNCIDIAIKENEGGVAALLIDEAIRLRQRANELFSVGELGRRQPQCAACGADDS